MQHRRRIHSSLKRTAVPFQALACTEFIRVAVQCTDAQILPSCRAVHHRLGSHLSLRRRKCANLICALLSLGRSASRRRGFPLVLYFPAGPLISLLFCAGRVCRGRSGDGRILAHSETGPLRHGGRRRVFWAGFFIVLGVLIIAVRLGGNQ